MPYPNNLSHANASYQTALIHELHLKATGPFKMTRRKSNHRHTHQDSNSIEKGLTLIQHEISQQTISTKRHKPEPAKEITEQLLTLIIFTSEQPLQSIPTRPPKQPKRTELTRISTSFHFNSRIKVKKRHLPRVSQGLRNATPSN